MANGFLSFNYSTEQPPTPVTTDSGFQSLNLGTPRSSAETTAGAVPQISPSSVPRTEPGTHQALTNVARPRDGLLQIKNQAEVSGHFSRQFQG